VVRMRLLLITTILFLSLMTPSTGKGTACPEGASSDSANIGNQLHEGARSLRFLGGSVNSASVGVKHHFSNHQAIQISLSVRGSGSWQNSKYEDEDEYLYQSSRFGFDLGTQYLHYYKPESVISPFAGLGASVGISFSSYDSKTILRETIDGNYNNSLSDGYNFGLQAILGFEWQLSERISLVSEQVAELSYTRDYTEQESSRSSSQESIRQSVQFGYKVMRLGFALYIR